MSEYNDLDVYFHRLAPTKYSDENLYEFYQDGYVLCHYGNTASFSDSDYSSTTDIERMVQCAEDGGICLVQLNAKNDYYDRGRKLGVVPSGTDPIMIGVRSDGTRTEEYTDVAAARKDLVDNPEVEIIYKGVKLEDVRTLDSNKYLLSAYEPPSVTFYPWYVVSNQIRSFLSDERLPLDDPTSYSPDQTERLCEEYLREVHNYYPLIQPGGSAGINQSFDLIGGICDDIVFGEVKNTQSVSESALESLKKEAGADRRAFYFSRTEVSNPPSGVEVVLLDDVIDTLLGIDRTTQMMERMTTR